MLQSPKHKQSTQLTNQRSKMPISIFPIFAITLTGILSSANVVHPITNVTSCSKFKVACYAQVFEHRHIHEPPKIATDLCTNIVYFFASLNEHTLTIEFDQGVDFKGDYGQQVAAYKERGIKVTVILGEWEGNVTTKYSRLVRCGSNRHHFIEHVVGFLADHNLDGLELVHKHPMCWEDQECKHPSDKFFPRFMDELSAAFKPRGLLLSVFVVGSRMIEMGYDLHSISGAADWIVVTTLMNNPLQANVTGCAATFMFLRDILLLVLPLYSIYRLFTRYFASSSVPPTVPKCGR